MTPARVIGWSIAALLGSLAAFAVITVTMLACAFVRLI